MHVPRVNLFVGSQLNLSFVLISISLSYHCSTFCTAWLLQRSFCKWQPHLARSSLSLIMGIELVLRVTSAVTACTPSPLLTQTGSCRPWYVARRKLLKSLASIQEFVLFTEIWTLQISSKRKSRTPTLSSVSITKNSLSVVLTSLNRFCRLRSCCSCSSHR